MVKAEDLLKLTKKERKQIRKIAKSHESETVCEIYGSLLGDILRMLDLNCFTHYRQYHNLSDELCERVLSFLQSDKIRECDLTCEIPAFIGIRLLGGIKFKALIQEKITKGEKHRAKRTTNKKIS